MKKKVFLIVNRNNIIEQVFMRRFKAIGWLKNYRNSIPKEVETEYFNNYEIIVGQLVFSER